MDMWKFRWRWSTAVFALVLLVVLLIIFRNRPRPGLSGAAVTASDSNVSSEQVEERSGRPTWKPAARTASTELATAEEIVAAKLSQFTRSRRDIMRAMARQKNIAVPDIVEQFFAAVESGNWSEIEPAFAALHGGEPNAGHSPTRSREVSQLWGPILDAYGAAEQVHEWPAQKLLDYGNAVLGSLRPGSVYVGGTDEGRWVPTLLNDTSEGQRHIVITQNGLADGTYLEYLRFLYADRFNTLTDDDSKRAFNDYMEDAGKRLAHDEQFPDEPKQVRPDETIRKDGGSISVSGMVAVMDINERLLRMLMEKNSELPFALQESYPLKGTYADATPLGPIMELRAPDPAGFTAERATESVAYWRDVAEQFRASADDTAQQTPIQSYAKLALGQANLLAGHGFNESAEQTYRIALGMVPNNGEVVTGLTELLERTGRINDARALMDNFERNYPKDFARLKRSRTSVNFSVSK